MLRVQKRRNHIYLISMIQTIYILWFQGFENAPEVVRHCVQSWKQYNPEWTIVLLSDTNLHEYVSMDYPEMDLWHRSDIVRMKLLSQYGGVWADATTFCHKPLNDWLPEYIGEGFFVFDRPYSNLMISNWFIYAEPSNRLLQEWASATLDYFRHHERAHTYFIPHHLFEQVCQTKECKQIWDAVPKFSAIIPHTLKSMEFLSNLHKDIDSKRVPIYKLSYKYQFQPYDVSMNMYYLYHTLNLT